MSNLANTISYESKSFLTGLRGEFEAPVSPPHVPLRPSLPAAGIRKNFSMATLRFGKAAGMVRGDPLLESSGKFPVPIHIGESGRPFNQSGKEIVFRAIFLTGTLGGTAKVSCCGGSTGAGRGSDSECIVRQL